MWYAVRACARIAGSRGRTGWRRFFSPSPSPGPPLYTPMTVANGSVTLARSRAVSVGVNVYHTVRRDALPKEQDDGGSPFSMVAAPRSTASLNGRAAMTVAVAKASFEAGTRWN